MKEESFDTPTPSDPGKVTARINKRRREEVILISPSDSETEIQGDYGGHLAKCAQHGQAKEEPTPSQRNEIRRKKKKNDATNEEVERNFALIVEEAKQKKSLEEIIAEEENEVVKKRREEVEQAHVTSEGGKGEKN